MCKNLGVQGSNSNFLVGKSEPITSVETFPRTTGGLGLAKQINLGSTNLNRRHGARDPECLTTNCAAARICMSISIKLSGQVTSKTLVYPVGLARRSVPQPRNPARVGYEISPHS